MLFFRKNEEIFCMQLLFRYFCGNIRMNPAVITDIKQLPMYQPVH